MVMVAVLIVAFVVAWLVTVVVVVVMVVLAQTEQNGDKRGQLGQNHFKDCDCPRDGEHPRDSYFP